MDELRFEVEWEPSSAVAHPAQARTWARLTIFIGDQCITKLHDKRDKTTRTGTYGSVLPLGEWIVRNFWFLLSEACPPGEPSVGWLRRHSLVAAREGGSLPDLRIFRDEDRVVADWRATEARHLPVDFVTAGTAELHPDSVRATLIRFVDAVVEQLRPVAHPDVEALSADWEAILSAAGTARKLCVRAAHMGLDAFDENEVPERLALVLTESLERLPEPTRGDLLDAGVAVERVASTTGAIAEIVSPPSGPSLVGSGTSDSAFVAPRATFPYQQGYAAARALREHVQQSVNGRVDLQALLSQLGYPEMHQHAAHWRDTDRSVKGIVGVSPQGKPTLIAPDLPREHQTRFLVARALYAVISGATADAPRLVTSSGTRLQAASRAFAAELLAPVDALRARMVGFPDEDALDQIAEEFGVSPTVVAKQLENYHAGRHAQLV